MTEMVERVAFATCASVLCICKNKLGFEGMPCLDRGRAAIAAMREPSDAMILALLREKFMDDTQQNRDMVTMDWQVMQRAALS